MSTRRLFEVMQQDKLLLCVHIFNAIWIIRLFHLNQSNIKSVYFYDFIFCFGFIFSFIFLNARSLIFLTTKINKLYTGSWDFSSLIQSNFDFLYGSIPYFFKIGPSEKIIATAAEKLNLSNEFPLMIINVANSLNAIKFPKKIIFIYLFVVIIILINIIIKFPPSISMRNFLSNWMAYSFYHTLGVGLFMYSSNYLFINFFKRKF